MPSSAASSARSFSSVPGTNVDELAAVALGSAVILLPLCGTLVLLFFSLSQVGAATSTVVVVLALLLSVGYTPDIPAGESYARLSSKGCSERWPVCGGAVAGGPPAAASPSAHVRRWCSCPAPGTGTEFFAEPRVTIVCLHGTFSSSHEFEAWAQELQGEAAAEGGSVEVIGVDLPGHGLTGPWEDAGCQPAYSVGADVGFLSCLLQRQELRGRQLVLVGHSIGGAIAAAYAARFPGSVAGLVLVAPWGLRHGPQDGGRQHCTWFVKFVLSPRWRFLSLWLCLLMVRVTPLPLLRYALGTAFGPGAPQVGEPPPKAPLVSAAAEQLHVHMLREGNRPTFVARISHMVAEERHALQSHARWRAELEGVRCPVQLQWGEADTWLHASRCLAWAEALGDRAADVRLWPGVGHCVMEQTPRRSAAAAWSFISGLGGLASTGGPAPAHVGG